MTKKYIFSFLVLFLLSFGSILRGQPPIPERSSPPRLVNDFANLMTINEQLQLEKQLVAYNDSTSTQIAVVTIADLGDYDIFDWAIEIGKKWGVGQAQKNNGVVILVGLAPKRKVFIATGGGVQGFLPDIICKRIIEQQIVPNFREKRFYEGFNAAFDVIRKAAKGEFQNESLTDSSTPVDGSVIFWVILILILIIVFIAIMIKNRRNSAEYAGHRRSYDSNNGGGGWIIGGGNFGGSGSSDWGGSSDSGSSFDGFGGGDFDGGGAGGDW